MQGSQANLSRDEENETQTRNRRKRGVYIEQNQTESNRTKQGPEMQVLIATNDMIVVTAFAQLRPARSLLILLQCDLHISNWDGFFGWRVGEKFI